MDPVSLVVAAVVAGLTAAATDVTKTAVKDTYDLFMSRLRKKVEGQENAQEALAGVEKRPDSKGWQEDLQKELAALEVDKDDELVTLAQAVLKKLDEKGAQAGKYNITISGGQGFVIGDHAKVEQHFGTKPDKSP